MEMRNWRTDRWESWGARWVALALVLGGPAWGCRAHPERNPLERGRRPNVVLVFADDMGWGDLGCQGALGFETPHLDRLASEGRRFTDFYVAQPVCGASRAALLTGVYPNRIGMHGAPDHTARYGLHDEEVTLAEILRGQGYATAIFGKWHLGHLPQFLPSAQGFDEWFGLPYSNDMWPFHPQAKGYYPDLPLMEGEKVVELNPDMNQLSARYLERALDFVRRNRERPFFLYLAHSMPHVPLGASDPFRGRTQRGLYGDVIEEVDASVGALSALLEELDLLEDTLFIFTSDNGPWLSYGDRGGSNGPLREGKGTTFEGGVRVPCLVRWPGHVPAGTLSHEPLMTIDLVPTIAKVVGAKLPRPVDGVDAAAWFFDPEPEGRAHGALFFYYRQNELQALRSGRYKLHFPHRYRTLGGRPGGVGGIPAAYDYVSTDLELYDLFVDPGEKRDLAQELPEVVARLSALAQEARVDMGDALTGAKGTGNRPPGLAAPEQEKKERPE